MEFISENELKIARNDILLIKRVAIKTSQRSLGNKITLSFNINIGGFTAISKGKKLMVERIDSNQVAISLPDPQPKEKIISFVFKAIIHPEITRFGGLQVIEWPSLDLYRVSTVKIPYQILGFKFVNKERNEPYWIADKNVTNKMKSHIASNRTSRIELIDGSLPTYKFSNRLILDCSGGGRINEIIINMPQTNSRQHTTVSITAEHELSRDNNGNTRIRLLNICEPGEKREVRIDIEVKLLKIPFYQQQFDYPKRKTYQQLARSNRELFEGNEFWVIDDPDIQMVSNSTKDMDTIWKVHRFLFEFTNRRLEYQANSIRIQSDEAFHSKKGDCSEFADLLITLHRIAGIPSRLKEGVIALKNNGQLYTEGHAWVEFLSPNGWIPCDPTWGIPIGVTGQHIGIQTHHTDPAPPAFQYTSTGPKPRVEWIYNLISVE